DGHAPALAVELADHMPPQVTTGAQAMDEQHRATRAAGVDVAGRTGPGAHLAAAGVDRVRGGRVIVHAIHADPRRCQNPHSRLSANPQPAIATAPGGHLAGYLEWRTW